MSFTIDNAKLDPRRHAWVKYVLERAVVYQSPAGHLFTDCLDDEGVFEREVDEGALTEVLRRYIEDELSSDRARIASQVELVRRHCGPGKLRVLDVGCGGGLFLVSMQQTGAEVEGLELKDSCVLYARRTHGLTVHKLPLDADFKPCTSCRCPTRATCRNCSARRAQPRCSRPSHARSSSFCPCQTSCWPSQGNGTTLDSSMVSWPQESRNANVRPSLRR
jgi:methionine biosynthesis protein MetW